jgi:hypothetical protein
VYWDPFPPELNNSARKGEGLAPLYFRYARAYSV